MIIIIYYNKISVNVASLMVLYSPFLWWYEMIQCLRDEIKGNEWCLEALGWSIKLILILCQSNDDIDGWMSGADNVNGWESLTVEVFLTS